MPQNDPSVKRRVWVGLIVACAGVGAWVVWNRVRPVSPLGDAQRPQAFVQLAGAGKAAGDQVLREKAELLDPTPLFFPTEWNYGQRTLPVSSLKQPGQVFGSVEPKLTVAEQNLEPYKVEASPDLAAWTTLAAAYLSQGAATSYTDTPPGGLLRRYYRVTR